MNKPSTSGQKVSNMPISRVNGEEERSDAPPVPREVTIGQVKAVLWLVASAVDAVLILGINGTGSTGLITLCGLLLINTALVLLP